MISCYLFVFVHIANLSCILIFPQKSLADSRNVCTFVDNIFNNDE